jgi:hypothetical protein
MDDHPIGSQHTQEWPHDMDLEGVKQESARLSPWAHVAWGTAAVPSRTSGRPSLATVARISSPELEAGSAEE